MDGTTKIGEGACLVMAAWLVWGEGLLSSELCLQLILAPNLSQSKKVSQSDLGSLPQEIIKISLYFYF